MRFGAFFCTIPTACFFAIIVLFSQGILMAQNPEYGGAAFRRVFEHGTIPEGVSKSPSITETFLGESGVFIMSSFQPKGIYYASGMGVSTIASSDQEAFSQAATWTFVGFRDPETMMFIPVNFGNPYPVYAYGTGGLNALTSPTPEQGISHGNYFNGKMVYLTIEGVGVGPKVWLYQEGQPEQLLMDLNSVPDLATYLDYDGKAFTYVTGKQDVDLAVWVQTEDGSRKRIIGHGDPLPGTEGTYRGFATIGSVYVSQNNVYVQGDTAETFPFFSVRSLFMSDGTTTEVIATQGMEIPGQNGMVLESFEVKRVENGNIWMIVTESGGTKAVYHIVDGSWNRVVSTKDSFDGRTPVGLTIFQEGMRGDRVAVLVSFLGANFRLANDLYVNADLPGVDGGTNGPSGPAMSIIRQPDGSWKLSIETEAGRTYTLQSSSDLGGWSNTENPRTADTDGSLEWTVPDTGAGTARFFRMLVE